MKTGTCYSPRANERLEKYNWPEASFAAVGPTVLIVSNGSRWAGSDAAWLDELLDVLKEEPLDPVFEEYGNFISTGPDLVAWDTLKPLTPPGWVSFHGNFFRLSHVFQIVTNDAGVIAELTAAIRANQGRSDYAAAKVAIAEAKERRRVEAEAQRRKDRRNSR